MRNVRKPPQSSPGLGRLPACFLTLLTVLAVPCAAQNRLKAVTAGALVKEPNGLKIGSLAAGGNYLVGKTVGTHVEVTVEGWLPSSAVLPASRDGYDLSVTIGGGESLRDKPNGTVIGRVQEGTLLSKAGAEGKWVKVKRTAFALKATFAPGDDAKSAAAAAPAKPVPSSAPGKPAPVTTASTAPGTKSKLVPDSTRPGGDAPASDSVSGTALIKGGTVVSATPDGKPAFTAEAATDAEVVGRARDWVKIRVEGWVRTSDVTAEVVSGPRITGTMVREKPDRFVGQSVTWRLQFLAVQEADALRPEMPAGQQYILARGPLPEAGFVYLMVTKEQVGAFRRLSPLDEVRVEAVVRAGRTKYLPTPVLELVKVETQ